MPVALLVLLLSLSRLFVPCSAAADAPTGILKVHGTVDGAEVWVDGALLGKTPLTKYLPSGVHQLRVIADNYDPFVRRLEVLADKTLAIAATLTAGAGTVEFSGPPGARLTVDGTERGSLPIRLPAPSVGAHTWRVEAPKLEPTDGKFDFTKGKNYLIKVTMASSAGVFAVVSTPPGAAVQIDGVDRGLTPLRLEGMPLGRHVVMLTHPELATVFRVVETADGSRGEVTVTLPKGGAALSVSTGSPDARVYAEDVLMGTGAHVDFGPIEKGRIKLRVESGGKSVTDTVTLPSRGTVALRLAGDELAERKPLLQRWGFWVAVGGGAVAASATTAAIAVGTSPEPPPAGDSVVVLP